MIFYLSETELPKDKSIFFALNSVYGIGTTTSQMVCKKLGLSANLKVKDLDDEHYIALENIFKSLNLTLSSDLKKIEKISLKKLVSIKSYRGLRKIKGLPIRGQRTRSNAKTARKNFKKI
jgi:small subunit ribosomal protein S13